MKIVTVLALLALVVAAPTLALAAEAQTTPAATATDRPRADYDPRAQPPVVPVPHVHPLKAPAADPHKKVSTTLGEIQVLISAAAASGAAQERAVGAQTIMEDLVKQAQPEAPEAVTGAP